MNLSQYEDHSTDLGSETFNSPSSTLQIDTQKVISLCEDLGNITLKMRDDGLEISEKPDGSVVTNADFFLSESLTRELPRIRPGSVITEENISNIDLSLIKDSDDWWLVDPIDGTSSFVKGFTGFAICAALIHDGRPILGVVAVPAEETIYYASEGGGAHKINTLTSVTESIHSNNNHVGPFILGCFHRYTDEQKSELHDFLSDLDLSDTIIQAESAATKYCKVADGSIDIAGGLRSLNLWDIAATDIIVSEAGGLMLNAKTGQEFQYTFMATEAVAPMAFGVRASGVATKLPLNA